MPAPAPRCHLADLDRRLEAIRQVRQEKAELERAYVRLRGQILPHLLVLVATLALCGAIMLAYDLIPAVHDFIDASMCIKHKDWCW